MEHEDQLEMVGADTCWSLKHGALPSPLWEPAGQWLSGRHYQGVLWVFGLYCEMLLCFSSTVSEGFISTDKTFKHKAHYGY